MAHFAQVNNGYVLRVIVVEQDVINSGQFGDPASWIQTSYNTKGGIHYDPVTQLPDDKPALRKNYAECGGIYDAQRDAFYSQRQNDYKGVVCESWILNEETCLWEPPSTRPENTETHHYMWNESTASWDEILDIIIP